MIIQDAQGKFVLKVDKTRRLVTEIQKGMVNADDVTRMDDAYRTKVIPYLGKEPWMKFCDLREYKPNTSANPERINEHLKWIMENGFKGGAILLDSATFKMQMNRATKDTIRPNYFDDEKKANDWLASQGF